MWFWTSLANLCIYSCFIQYPCVFIKGSGHWAPSWPNSPPILPLESTSGKTLSHLNESLPNTSFTNYFWRDEYKYWRPVHAYIWKRSLTFSRFLFSCHSPCFFLSCVHYFNSNTDTSDSSQHTVGQVLHANCGFFSFFSFIELHCQISLSVSLLQ